MPAQPTEVQTCYRHPDRRAGVRCQRCERPICPNCMVQASVGFHCPECSRSGRQRVLTARSLATRPIITQVLVAVNAAVFVAGLASSSANSFAGRGGFIVDGGLLARPVADGDWWRIITSGFLHAGLLHLGFNMFALWVLGSQLETVLGRLRYALLYGVSLLTGALGVMLLSPDTLTVGASGAIFGLLGAAAAGQKAQGIDLRDSGLAGILMINLLFTFLVPGISIGGHLGGLAGGFVVGWLFLGRTKFPNPAVPAAVSALIGLAAAGGSLYLASNPLV